MCLAVVLFGFLLLGTLCVSWIWVTFSLLRLGKFSILLFHTCFLSLGLILLLLVSVLYGYCYVSCFPAFPLVPLHSSQPLFLFLLFLGRFFYFVLQLADPIFCFRKSAFHSFYCVLQFRNCILHFLSLIHISEPTRLRISSRMPSSA